MSQPKPRQKVHVISMGCAKNLVDSEKLMAQLKLSNIELTGSIEDAAPAKADTAAQEVKKARAKGKNKAGGAAKDKAE